LSLYRSVSSPTRASSSQPSATPHDADHPASPRHVPRTVLSWTSDALGPSTTTRKHRFLPGFGL
jgi:hypothetical protein